MVSSRRAPNSPIHCTKENTRAPPPRMYTLSFKSFEKVEKLRMKMFARIIQRDDIGKNYYLSDLELFFDDRKNPRLLLRAIRITIINISTIHPLFNQRKEKV